ncbi:MarR family transcriptional regulator [Paenibacillus sp. KQZ6P-2]|uniref:MarR family transcriptional regulator n=1 Tax=Paenibacillus mangrovi TaxID=2931978 RepID=A0A9X1WQ47_9BACL|nr:MarR family transcriptional regulator [Paenibacillus mangrovi]MCJ8011240.1 MarR family transcriptional regulator [Paenibacillus mangrovi]
METLANRLYAAVKSFWWSLETDVCKEMQEFLTGPQLFMLGYIHSERKCNLSKVADRLEVKPSAVTVMVDRLEKSGFVVRSQDPADRRVILVEATPLGEEVLAKAIQKRDQRIREHLSRLEPDEVLIVTELCEKMIGLQQDKS